MSGTRPSDSSAQMRRMARRAARRGSAAIMRHHFNDVAIEPHVGRAVDVAHAPGREKLDARRPLSKESARCQGPARPR
jgi:hypothetical protein